MGRARKTAWRLEGFTKGQAGRRAVGVVLAVGCLLTRNRGISGQKVAFKGDGCLRMGISRGRKGVPSGALLAFCGRAAGSGFRSGGVTPSNGGFCPEWLVFRVGCGSVPNVGVAGLLAGLGLQPALGCSREMWPLEFANCAARQAVGESPVSCLKAWAKAACCG